jgi:hypothetical protein
MRCKRPRTRKLFGKPLSYHKRLALGKQSFMLICAALFNFGYCLRKQASQLPNKSVEKSNKQFLKQMPGANPGGAFRFVL